MLSPSSHYSITASARVGICDSTCFHHTKQAVPVRQSCWDRPTGCLASRHLVAIKLALTSCTLPAHDITLNETKGKHAPL